MAVISYKYPKEKDIKLNKYFKVGEFHSVNDKTATVVLIDTVLVSMLKSIRTYFNMPITIRSGYRSIAYNEQIDGADGSWHTKGKAADIRVNYGKPDELDPRLLAMYCDVLGFGGVGRYMYSPTVKWVHVDTGTKGSYWYKNSATGKYNYVSTFLPTLKKVSVYGIWTNKYEVKIAQHLLSKQGFYKGIIDGKFWTGTKTAVSNFQKAKGMVVTGIIDRSTWIALFKGVKTYF